MQLPKDNHSFPGVPLEGHLCALRRGSQKYYWRVEKLISESAKLPISEWEVNELISRLGNSTWFGPDDRPTITEILKHIHRAIDTDLRHPIILSSDGKIMDGCHRLVAATIQGATKLPTVQFTSDPEPDYIEGVQS